MKKSRIFTLILVFLSLSSALLAQKDSSKTDTPFNVSCDLMSRYIWRGLDLGSSPSIQPGIEFCKGGFAIGTWGAFSTNLMGGQETDLYASYTLNDMFSLTVTDYFFPNEIEDYKYFDYARESTGHIFEGLISFNGTVKLPLSILVATNFWGADAKKLKDDGSEDGIQYSTYAEIAYSYKNINLFMGFNVISPDTDKGEVGFYGDSFGVINLGLTASKEINFADKFSLPISVSLITNPQADKIYMTAGFTF